METNEKVENLSQKVANTFWWDTFAWQFIMRGVLTLVLGAITKSITSSYAKSFDIGSFLKSSSNYLESFSTMATRVNNLSIITTLISVLISTIFVVISIKMAIKIIRERVSLHSDMISTIHRTTKLNTIILMCVCIIASLISYFVNGTLLANCAITVLGYIIHAIIWIEFANKSLDDEIIRNSVKNT